MTFEYKPDEEMRAMSDTALVNYSVALRAELGRQGNTQSIEREIAKDMVLMLNSRIITKEHQIDDAEHMKIRRNGTIVVTILGIVLLIIFTASELGYIQ